MLVELGQSIKAYRARIVYERKVKVDSSVAGKEVILIPTRKGNIELRKVMGDITVPFYGRC